MKRAKCREEKRRAVKGGGRERRPDVKDPERGRSKGREGRIEGCEGEGEEGRVNRGGQRKRRAGL